MIDKTPTHLSSFLRLVEESGPANIFPCIRDLVENGCALERFSENDPKPSRQAFTQYMATWFRYAAVPQDACTAWMKEFCAEVLGSISSSSSSQIRHSTKSMIKFVYRDSVPFQCECEDNRFKLHCSEKCPVHAEMSENIAGNNGDANHRQTRRGPIVVYDPQEMEVAYNKKRNYREQFLKAMEKAVESVEQGMSRQEIVDLLNGMDFKTRTGRKWTYGILRNELKQLEEGVEL